MKYSSHLLEQQKDHNIPKGQEIKAFILKEFKHITRDKQTILILVIMPLVLISLFGFALSMEVKGTEVVIVDEQKTQTSRNLYERINANKYFSVKQTLNNVKDVETYLKQGKADIGIILSKNQGVQILADGSEPNQAQTRVAYILQIMNPVLTKGGNISSRMLFNPQLKSEYNLVPGVIGVILLLICAMMSSISIVREKERGTMEILLASPLAPSSIIIAKLIPYLVVSSINLATILLLSYFVLGVPIAGSVVLFCIITVLYILVALSLGLFISTLVSSQLAAMLLSLLMIVPAIYLSGMIFPIESMPVAAATISNIIPTRWFIDASRKIMIQGVSFQYLIKNFVILIVMAIVLISVSVKLYKTRLE